MPRSCGKSWHMAERFFRRPLTPRVIAYHIARERVRSKTAEEAVARAMQKIKGLFSCDHVSEKTGWEQEDPQGSAHCASEKGNAYVLAEVKPVHWIRSVPSL